jgi:hypothetical protein
VEGIIPAAPPVSPLKSISPTQFVSLRECALKGVWGANRVPPLLPPAPAARLGSVIHQLLEEAGEGRFVSGDRSGIDHRWQELISESHTAMRGSWLERHFVPLSASVHDFEVRRIQAIERAQEVAAGRAVAPEPPREIGERAPYGYELPVSTSDGLVRGQIDAVLCSETGPLIRDYKSGAIFDTRSKGALVVKAAYEVQLQLYAGLYAEATGTWPARLEVVPVLGGPVPVPFERSACTALLNEARAELERTNNTIKRHDSSPLQLQQILASPDASACGSCLYRPACTPYREATSAGQGWPNDLRVCFHGCISSPRKPRQRASGSHNGEGGACLVGCRAKKSSIERTSSWKPGMAQPPWGICKTRLTSSSTSFSASRRDRMATVLSSMP